MDMHCRLSSCVLHFQLKTLSKAVIDRTLLKVEFPSAEFSSAAARPTEQN